MLKVAWEFIRDPAVALSVVGALVIGWLIGDASGEIAASRRCDTAQLRQKLAAAEAQRKTLEDRLAAIAQASAKQSAQAVTDQAADQRNVEAVHATPPNPAACLDRDAARRLRDIR